MMIFMAHYQHCTFTSTAQEGLFHLLRTTTQHKSHHHVMLSTTQTDSHYPTLSQIAFRMELLLHLDMEVAAGQLSYKQRA